MKKMFNLAVAIVAMCSAVSLTSCDKFFGNSAGNDQNNDDTNIVDTLGNAPADTANVKETPEAATPEADKAEAPASADKAPAATEKASDTPAEKK